VVVERENDTKSSGADSAGLAVMGSAGKDQLSNMYALLVLSSLMFDGRGPNDILELAADSVPKLSRSTTDAAYRIVAGSLADSRDPGRLLGNELDAALAENLGVDRKLAWPTEFGVTRSLCAQCGALLGCWWCALRPRRHPTSSLCSRLSRSRPPPR
jgi:hypothetical protein